MEKQETTGNEEQTRICRSCGRELPLEMFRTSRLGRLRTCKDCVRQHQVSSKADKKMAKFKEEDAARARLLRLSDFKPRELMAELKRRGYEFVIKYTETHVIKSDDIEV